MLFRGYIDESYNDQVFVLSCLITQGGEWIWIEWEWEECIDRWNERLRKQGRRTLTRYHGADCSNRKHEFKGWSVDERNEFLVYTLGDEVFARIPAANISLVHDKSGYDGTMEEAFRQCLKDRTFKHKDCFSSFCSRKTEDCTALECADFLAYINFKESMSLISGSGRSKPLEMLIDGQRLGGGVKLVSEKALRSLKKWLDTHSKTRAGAERSSATHKQD